MGALTKGSLVTILLRSIGAVLVFTLQVLLARVLGVGEYGIYSFVISCVSIIALFSTLGFETSLARFLPEYFKEKQWSKFYGVLKFSFGACFIFSSLAVVLVLIFIFIVDQFESRFALMCALPLIVLVTLANLRISALRSMKKYLEAVFPEAILKPIIMIFLITVYYLLESNIQAHEAIVIQVISTGVVLVIGGELLRRTLKAVSDYEKPCFLAKYWIRVSLPMLLITGSAYIISQTDIVMLGVLKGMEHSGVYSAVSRLSEVAIFFMAAVNFVAGPLISEAYQERDLRMLAKVVAKSTRISFSLAFLSLVVFLLAGERFLGLFGGDFVGGYYALLVLVFGHLVNAAAGPVGMLLSLTGYQQYAAKLMTMSALLNIGFNFILIPEYGLLGAALSSMSSTIIWNVLMWWKVRAMLHINSSITAKF